MKVKLVLIILLISTTYFSQNPEKTVYLSAFYGFPNVVTTYNGSSYSSMLPDIDISSGKGIGPLGLRSEIKFKRIGCGLDLIYNSLSKSYINNYWNNEDSVSYEYSSKVTYKQLRILGRINFYVLQNDKTHAYFGLGAGFRTLNTKEESDLESYNSQNKRNGTSFRLCFGFRRMFNEKLGLSVEVGFGGSMLSGGLSYKIYNR